MNENPKDHKKKPQRLDKNGRPYPEHKPHSGGSSGTKNKRTAGGTKRVKTHRETPRAAYPMDWFFLHREACSVERLKEALTDVPELDIEVWPALQVMELTFPSRVFIDFEYIAQPPEEDPLQALLTREGIQTMYYVSVEPYCGEEELAFLQKLAGCTGGLIAADNDTLTPLFR